MAPPAPVGFTLFTGGLGGPASGLIGQGYGSAAEEAYTETASGGLSFGPATVPVMDAIAMPAGGMRSGGDSLVIHVAWPGASGGSRQGGSAATGGTTQFAATASGGTGQGGCAATAGSIQFAASGGWGTGGAAGHHDTSQFAGFVPQDLPFAMRQSTDSETPWIGTPTVLLRRSGDGTHWITPEGLVSAIGDGFYVVAANADDQDKSGPLYLYATGVCADPAWECYWVGDAEGWTQGVTTWPFPVVLVQAGPNLPLVGASPAVQIATPGGTMRSPTSGSSITEAGYGFYDLWLVATDVSEVGWLQVYATAADAEPAQETFWIWPASTAPPPPSGQTFRQTLLAKLSSIPELTSLVDTAIYPGAAPRTHDLGRDGPALTYAITTYPRGQVLSGSDGTGMPRVQLSAWSYSQADG